MSCGMQDIGGMHKLIAFTGYAGCGKDLAAQILIDEHNFQRRCFGDIIKRQLAPVIKEHFGFDPLTADHQQKSQIRSTLESWGNENYTAIMDEFFTDLPDRCVNTRICRRREAVEWKERGGVIIEIIRFDLAVEPGPSDKQWLMEIEPFVDRTIYNRTTPESLWTQVMEVAAEG